MRKPPEPNSKFDQEELDRLNAKPWMIALLDLNPSYPFWGPHEDYMINKGQGWNVPQIFESWQEFGNWKLDDLNECVDFYFEIDRESTACTACGGCGYHPAAQWVSESFYRHSSPFCGRTMREDVTKALMDSFGSDGDDSILRPNTFPSTELQSKYKPGFAEFAKQMRDGDGFWCDQITQDELDTLWEHKRLGNMQGKEKPSLATVNAANSFDNSYKNFEYNHDAINRGILIEQRCKRFGMPKYCLECKGHGYVFTAPVAHVNLVLWIIHPRKGASRGIEIKYIQHADLQAVFAFLMEAAKRNAERFEKVISRFHKAILRD